MALAHAAAAGDGEDREIPQVSMERPGKAGKAGGPPPRRRRYGEVAPKLAQDAARAKAEQETRLRGWSSTNAGEGRHVEKTTDR